MGIFTPSEAAGIGAIGALLIGLVARRLTRQSFIQSISETGQFTAMVFIMVIGAMIFTRFLAISQLPTVMAEFVAGLEVNRYFILIGILIFYILLGCVLDIMAALILTMPILFPTIVGLGFHPIWFGVLFVRLSEVGVITPPFGMLIFILSGVFRTGFPVVSMELNCSFAASVARSELWSKVSRTRSTSAFSFLQISLTFSQSRSSGTVRVPVPGRFTFSGITIVFPGQF